MADQDTTKQQSPKSPVDWIMLRARQGLEAAAARAAAKGRK